jgi:hypothetical protein
VKEDYVKGGRRKPPFAAFLWRECEGHCVPVIFVETDILTIFGTAGACRRTKQNEKVPAIAGPGLRSSPPGPCECPAPPGVTGFSGLRIQIERQK